MVLRTDGWFFLSSRTIKIPPLITSLIVNCRWIELKTNAWQERVSVSDEEERQTFASQCYDCLQRLWMTSRSSVKRRTWRCHPLNSQQWLNFCRFITIQVSGTKVLMSLFHWNNCLFLNIFILSTNNFIIQIFWEINLYARTYLHLILS